GAALWLGRGGGKQRRGRPDPLCQAQIRQGRYPQCERGRLDDRKGFEVTSLRRVAIYWLAALHLAIGTIATVTSYVLASREASELLDGQLRQIAYFVDDESRSPPLPNSSDTPHDPGDDFLVQIWDAQGHLRSSNSAIALPRQNVAGFSTTNM